MSEILQSPPATDRWLSCPECGATCRDRDLPPRAGIRCSRCGVWVKREPGPRALQRAWALATTGLILVVLANTTPILTFDVLGNLQSNHLISGVTGLTAQGYWPVAALVFFAGIAGPALHLALVWYVLTACCLSIRWPGLRRAAKAAEILESWNLVPVYVVAAVVAVVKLDMLGAVSWQQGVFWLIALSICSLCTVQFFNRNLVEERLEELAA